MSNPGFHVAGQSYMFSPQPQPLYAVQGGIDYALETGKIRPVLNTSFENRPMRMISMPVSKYPADEASRYDSFSCDWVPKDWAAALKTMPDSVRVNWQSTLTRVKDLTSGMLIPSTGVGFSSGAPDNSHKILEAIKSHLLSQLDPNKLLSGQGPAMIQRCMTVWIDNFIFLYDESSMPEPVLLLGEFKKSASMYGQPPTQIHGWVVAGGGHAEAKGIKLFGVEAGSVTLKAAADKELEEETKIPLDKVRAWTLFGAIDRPDNDPRRHGLRSAIFLRWVDTYPQSTQELKKFVGVPLSQLPALCNQGSYNGLPLVLGHADMIRMVMDDIDTREFINWCLNPVQRARFRALQNQMNGSIPQAYPSFSANPYAPSGMRPNYGGF